MEHHGSPATTAKSGCLFSGTVHRPFATAAKTSGVTSRSICFGSSPGHSTISTCSPRFLAAFRTNSATAVRWQVILPSRLGNWHPQKKRPPHQNLWVKSGSGKAPRR